jgi:hypothetical protein
MRRGLIVHYVDEMPEVLTRALASPIRTTDEERRQRLSLA